MAHSSKTQSTLVVMLVGMLVLGCSFSFLIQFIIVEVEWFSTIKCVGGTFFFKESNINNAIQTFQQLASRVILDMFAIYNCTHTKKIHPNREWELHKNLSDQSKTEAQQGKTQIPPR